MSEDSGLVRAWRGWMRQRPWRSLSFAGPVGGAVVGVLTAVIYVSVGSLFSSAEDLGSILPYVIVVGAIVGFVVGVPSAIGALVFRLVVLFGATKRTRAFAVGLGAALGSSPALIFLAVASGSEQLYVILPIAGGVLAGLALGFVELSNTSAD